MAACRGSSSLSQRFVFALLPRDELPTSD